MNDKSAKYGIGSIVRHRVYPFRGVVVDVDPEFDNTDEWYTNEPDRLGYDGLSLDDGQRTYLRAFEPLDPDASDSQVLERYLRVTAFLIANLTQYPDDIDRAIKGSVLGILPIVAKGIAVGRRGRTT